MRVEIDDRSGFCFGVVNAITKAEESLATAGQVFCLGDIVHNRLEVSRLEDMGLRGISRGELPLLKGETILIRAHGEPPSTYKKAREYGLDIIDATCPVVAALQKKVVAAYGMMKKAGGQVVILGKKGHAEVVGLTGQVGEDVIVVEGVNDLSLVDFSKPVYLLSQTTQSLPLFEKVKNEILERVKDKGTVTVDDTICRQVSNRNPHLQEFAARYDVVVFVSGKKSSNGEALFQACKKANPDSYKIEDGDELRSEWFEGKESVGVCGATSTPKWLMQEIAERIGTIARQRTRV